VTPVTGPSRGLGYRVPRPAVRGTDGNNGNWRTLQDGSGPRAVLLRRRVHKARRNQERGNDEAKRMTTTQRRLTPAIVVAALTLLGCEEPQTAAVNNEIVYDGQSLSAVRDWVSSETDQEANPTASSATPAPPVGDMIGGLEDRLRANPDDLKGWSLLAQSYAFTGRMQEAADAVDRAVVLGADRASLEARVLKAHTGQR